MTTEAVAEAPPARRRAWRLVPLAFVLGGLFYFGPRLARHDLDLRVQGLECASEISIDLFLEDVRVRGVRLPTRGDDEVHYLAPLAAGAYLAKLGLVCPEGPSPPVLELPLVVEGEGNRDLVVSPGCPCPTPR